MPQSSSLADTVGFELLGPRLGKDLSSSLQAALSKGVSIPKGRNAIAILRGALAASIRDVESHPRGRLFQEFLRKGPYEDSGEIPEAMVDQRMSDADAASAITFIYSYMVNSFKGTLAELLATQPCLLLMQKLQREGKVPRAARLYVGDSVLVHRASTRGVLKGADLHILIEESQLSSTPGITVVGLVEVKSYFQAASHIGRQIDRHLQRAKHGLHVNGVDYPGQQTTVGVGRDRKIIRTLVLPSRWKLSRSFRFEKTGSGRSLIVDPCEPPSKDDCIERLGEDNWCITLRWSKEAIEEAAYEMTFWYMGKVGEIIYSESVPKEWKGMNPSEAGRNAVKMMLYYAILRARTSSEEQRAIALYNTYGFGYSIGMNYRNADGKREMLWPQDLDEILSNRRTKAGCTIW